MTLERCSRSTCSVVASPAGSRPAKHLRRGSRLNRQILERRAVEAQRAAEDRHQPEESLDASIHLKTRDPCGRPVSGREEMVKMEDGDNGARSIAQKQARLAEESSEGRRAIACHDAPTTVQ